MLTLLVLSKLHCNTVSLFVCVASFSLVPFSLLSRLFSPLSFPVSVLPPPPLVLPPVLSSLLVSHKLAVLCQPPFSPWAVLHVEMLTLPFSELSVRTLRPLRTNAVLCGSGSSSCTLVLLLAAHVANHSSTHVYPYIYCFFSPFLSFFFCVLLSLSF